MAPIKFQQAVMTVTLFCVPTYTLWLVTRDGRYREPFTAALLGRC